MFFKKKKKEEEKVNLDNSTFSYWNKATVGQFVSLSDEQAIEDAMRLGNGTTCMDYQIKAIIKIDELNNLAKWILLQLDCPEEEIYIMVKSVSEEIDLRAYFILPEIEAGSRQDLLNDGMDWLFEDTSQSSAEDLSFTHQIVQHTEKDGEDLELLFKRKRQGELTGTCTITGDAQQLLGTIVEYSTDTDWENPEMLILETGPRDSHTSYVRVMAGNSLSLSEAELL